MANETRILGCPAVRESAYEEEKALWLDLLARGPAGTKAVIVAEFEMDESDLQTDYFNSITVRRVVIGYRKGMREDFRQLRKAAATFAETAHLGPGCAHVSVYATMTRDQPMAGRYAGQFAGFGYALHGTTYSTRQAAEAAIATQAGVLPEDVAYTIREESIEHRDNYSMGHGNWLGVDRHSGWQVRSVTDCPGPFETNEEAAPKLPKCKLVGTDGNVFAIIGTVARALKGAGQTDRAKEFTARAFASHSYDAVLVLCHEYVDVR